MNPQYILNFSKDGDAKIYNCIPYRRRTALETFKQTAKYIFRDVVGFFQTYKPLFDAITKLLKIRNHFLDCA